MARSMAIAAVAPGGSFAVGSALVLDELEHHRAGIGCMLESGGRGVVISVVVPGFVLLRVSPTPRAGLWAVVLGRGAGAASRRGL